MVKDSLIYCVLYTIILITIVLSIMYHENKTVYYLPLMLGTIPIMVCYRGCRKRRDVTVIATILNDEGYPVAYGSTMCQPH
jgi:hypothetical protein